MRIQRDEILSRMEGNLDNKKKLHDQIERLGLIEAQKKAENKTFRLVISNSDPDPNLWKTQKGPKCKHCGFENNLKIDPVCQHCKKTIMMSKNPRQRTLEQSNQADAQSLTVRQRGFCRSKVVGLKALEMTWLIDKVVRMQRPNFRKKNPHLSLWQPRLDETF